MPYRYLNIWTILLGLAGLALVIALWLLGKDLHRSAQTGPAWKRCLVGAVTRFCPS